MACWLHPVLICPVREEFSDAVLRGVLFQFQRRNRISLQNDFTRQNDKPLSGANCSHAENILTFNVLATVKTRNIIYLFLTWPDDWWLTVYAWSVIYKYLYTPDEILACFKYR